MIKLDHHKGKKKKLIWTGGKSTRNHVASDKCNHNLFLTVTDSLPLQANPYIPTELVNIHQARVL